MTASNLTNGQNLTVRYLEESISYPYPQQSTTVNDLISQLRSEFDLPEDEPLALYKDGLRLARTAVLGSSGIRVGDDLELKPTQKKKPLSIRIHTLSGKGLVYSMNDKNTMKDLYETIRTSTNPSLPNGTFPVLFNHRMVLIESDDLLMAYLELLRFIRWEGNSIPHFYLFECPSQFQNEYLCYRKQNKKELFFNNELWQPVSCRKQTDDALSTFLLSFYALTSFFDTKVEYEHDDLNKTHFYHFLASLRQTLFPPACLALYHMIQGTLHDFEKQLISESFYHLLDQCLPSTIPRDQLFLYTPYILYQNLQKADYTSMKADNYTTILLCSLCFDGDTNHEKHIYFKKPACDINELSKGFKLYDREGCDSSLIKTTDILQPDLKAFMKLLETSTSITPTHSGLDEYTIWLPSEQSNLPQVGDIFQQRKSIGRLTGDQLTTIRTELCTNDMFSFLSFAQASKLSKHNSMQFVLLHEPRRIVYLMNASKDVSGCFGVFDPFDGKKDKITKDEVASDDILYQYQHIAVRDNPLDIRPIEQITMLLMDVSGSMNQPRVAGSISPLDLSITALGIWSDRLFSFKPPHAVGLIYFGAEINKTTKLIQEGNPITRNFKDLENSLIFRPGCGSSTPLYETVNVALTKMDEFVEKNKDKISSDCKKFIFCFSDGEDTCSQIDLETISERLRASHVMFDSMCFTPEKASSLVRLCESSKGYYFFPIPTQKEDLINLFEREPTIAIKYRDESVYGVIEHPKLREASFLYAPAINVSQAPIQDITVSNETLMRVFREAKDLKRVPLDNVTVYIGKENVLFWKLILEGPIGTKYVNYRWVLSVEFHPQLYPLRPPEIRFQTPIYHCNISDDGKVCHEILRTHWTSHTTMRDVLKQINTLLSEPEALDALSTKKGELLRRSPKEYYTELKAFHDKHAIASIDELKQQFYLEQNYY